MKWGWKQTERSAWIVKTFLSLASFLFLSGGPGLRMRGLQRQAKGAKEWGLQERAETKDGPWSYSGKLSLDLWCRSQHFGLDWDWGLRFLWLFWLVGLVELMSSATMPFWERWKLPRTGVGAGAALLCACGALLYGGCGEVWKGWRRDCSVWGFLVVGGLCLLSFVLWLGALGLEIHRWRMGPGSRRTVSTAGTFSLTTQKDSDPEPGYPKTRQGSNLSVNTCNDAIFLGEAPSSDRNNPGVPPLLEDPWEQTSQLSKSRRIRTRSKILPTRNRSKQIELDVKTIGSSQDTQSRREDEGDTSVDDSKTTKTSKTSRTSFASSASMASMSAFPSPVSGGGKEEENLSPKLCFNRSPSIPSLQN